MIIGICGFQSSGKDTIADYLVKNYNFIKLSFAGVLKDIIAIIFGWSRDKLEGITKEDREWREQVDLWWSNELNMPQLTPRYVMQYFGTELFRNHWHPDIWTKVIEKKLNTYNNIVITDCRFTNEMEMLKKYNCKFIHVYRNIPYWFNDYKNGKDDIKEANEMHQSNKEWIRFPCDFEIINDTCIDNLYDKINEYLLI